MSLYPENPEIGEVFNNRQWSGTAWVAINNVLTAAYTELSQFNTHTSASVNVHGIINSASVVYADDAKLSDERIPLNESVTDLKIVSGGLSASTITGGAVVENDLDVYLTQSSASSLYLTQNSASATYLDQISASGLYLTQVSASETYLDQLSATETFLTQTSASTTYLTQSNASATYATSASPTFTGVVTLPSTKEKTILGTISANVFTADFSNGNVFYITTAPSANFTINIINLPTENDNVFSFSFFVLQGATGYIPNALQIQGSSQTIKWAGGNAPSPTSGAGKVDVFNFTLIRRSSAWEALGDISKNY
jgi:hypothetical protein